MVLAVAMPSRERSWAAPRPCPWASCRTIKAGSPWPSSWLVRATSDPVQDPLRDRRVQQRLPRRDSAHRLHEIVAAHLLEQESGRARFDRGEPSAEIARGLLSDAGFKEDITAGSPSNNAAARRWGNLEGLLGFSSQGFVDAWAPVFFFAMIFAISMDYTVFLLSSAKEHWDRSRDPRDAMVGGLAHSGRVILAAAGVMVAVFFTFALSGPLPPKEMGVILGIAVLLDALLVRLVLVPVLLRFAGRWAWWLPSWMDRMLPDVRFGHS